MSNKKETERFILNLVYNENTELIIEHKDKPDFWISNSLMENFGVEITEIYKNQSDARLRNIHDYTGELLDLKKYRHKD